VIPSPRVSTGSRATQIHVMLWELFEPPSRKSSVTSDNPLVRISLDDDDRIVGFVRSQPLSHLSADTR